ncbi:MAG TPA: bifunctional hydroxymethylpyrimidine kinase/phosphomethylpyrimidine kinase [Candidatus Altiarchaeales archaeon]|nr:bifunctional hydroxymethylpyrimidine kinase/phosphomethylpyrimidine kinase [Candidatus Altiarchaeales archaeon]
MKVKSVLTIAGSDSGGGAGIQQDLKVFSSFRLHGTSVLTAITAQNTLGVQKVFVLPVEIIEEQIDSVMNDLRPVAVKTGMLPTREIIKLVYRKISEYNIEKLIVDPVMVSTSKDKLVTENILKVLKKLISLSTLCTPNIKEVEILSGIKIRDLKGMEIAAKKIGNCVVKGGHLNFTDILHYNGKQYRFESKIKWKGQIHGTGCAFASAITAGLANGLGVVESVRNAKEFMDSIICRNFSIGSGLPITDTSCIRLGRHYMNEGKYGVIENIEMAMLRFINEINSYKLVPQVGINIAMGLPDSKGIEDVAGISGRLVRDEKRIVPVGTIEFGGSSHMGRVVLTVMKFDPEKRAAMNIRLSDEILNACRKLNLKISDFDRDDQPGDMKTMEWGTSHSIKKIGSVPDVIYDKGGLGKEAMIRILGKNALDVVDTAIRIANLLGD